MLGLGLWWIKGGCFHKEPVEQLVLIPVNEEVTGKVLSEILFPHSRPLHSFHNILPQSLSFLCVYCRDAQIHKILTVVGEVCVSVVLDSQVHYTPPHHSPPLSLDECILLLINNMPLSLFSARGASIGRMNSFLESHSIPPNAQILLIHTSSSQRGSCRSQPRCLLSQLDLDAPTRTVSPWSSCSTSFHMFWGRSAGSW